MMTIKEIEYPSYTTTGAQPHVYWSAIWSGAFASLALSGCFGLLGIGVGAIRVPAGGIVTSVSIGGGAWLIVSGAIAFFIGGWVGARLAGVGRISDSVLHGLVSWALAMVGLLLLLPAIGGVFGLSAYSRPIPGGGVGFGWAAPGAVFRLGVTAFLLTAIDCVAACWGALYGTRLLMPVPVERYHRTARQETVASR